MAAAKKEINADRMLSRLGLSHPAELLLYVPRDFKDYRKEIRDIREIVAGDGYGAFTIRSKKTYDAAGRPTTFKPVRLDAELEDKFGRTIRATTFGNVWPWAERNVGDTIHIHFRAKPFNNQMSLSSIEFVPEYLRGRMAPIYNAVRAKASSETVSNMVRGAMEHIRDAGAILAGFTGIRESDLAAASGFANLQDLFRAMHEPKSREDFGKALEGAFQICKLETLEKAKRISARLPNKKSMILASEDVIDEFTAFTLMPDQKSAMLDIITDLRSPMPMRRLISGDVGTGKSVTYMLPLISAWKKGAVVHVVAPNESLVNQLANELQEYGPDVQIAKVTGRSKPESPEGKILIGTTALINYAVKNNIQPDFLVCDEQHKLSREQRERVVGPHTNLLEATATAIPRSMALITHGGMDVSTLRDCPVKKTIHSKVVLDDAGKRDAFTRIKEIINAGDQVAIVYSMVEDSKPGASNGKQSADSKQSKTAQEKASKLKSVESSFDQWERMFPGKVVKAHGQMHPDEKMDAIEALKDGRAQIVVTTSVIEVGLTIPKMRGMLINDADRFGTSALHQLRGRLARKGGEGFFFLQPSAEASPDAMLRLETVEAYSDGFKLSEMDMELRGFGDLDTESDSQSGDAVITLKNVAIKPSDFRDLVAPETSDEELKELHRREGLVLALEEAIEGATAPARAPAPVPARPAAAQPAKPAAAPTEQRVRPKPRFF